MQSDGSDLLLGIKKEKQVKNCKIDKKNTNFVERMASFLRAKEWNANGCSLKWAILSERGENGKSKWVKEQKR